MKAIIGGALMVIGVAGVASAQEPIGGSFTQIHGSYVALQYATERGAAPEARFAFAGLEASRVDDAALPSRGGLRSAVAFSEVRLTSVKGRTVAASPQRPRPR